MSTSPGASHPLAARLWAALQTYNVDDLKAMFAPNFRRWINVTDAEEDSDRVVQAIRMERALVKDSTFSLRRETRTEDGFLLLFDVTGRLADDQAWSAAVCLVVTASPTEIFRMDEYVDSRGLRPLLRALTAVH